MNTLAVKCSFMKKWTPRLLERPGLKVTLTSPAQEGQDGDRQLKSSGAAFSLTLGLLNDTWELTPPGPREQSHK